MKIGGFQPVSLSDFPGMTAAIVFTQGCNFRCPFCHNGSLLSKFCNFEDSFKKEVVLDCLRQRRKLLDGVVISGGEPTLQPDLPEFINEIRQMDYRVKLDTNGSCPEVIDELIKQELVDFIAMDVKAPLEKYDLLAGVPVNIENIKRSIRLITLSRCEVLFRTTMVEELLTDEDISKIKEIIPEQAEYKVQPFMPGNALDIELRQKALCANG